MKRTEKKEKPIPIRCVCGMQAAIIHFKGKKMVSCSNLEKCIANLRTPWLGSEDQAIENWNTTIRSYQYPRR